VAASGYSLNGNQVKLSQGITTSYSSGTTTDDIDTVLLNGAVSIGSGGTFVVHGTVSGTSGLTFSGGGMLVLSGMAVNSYTGTTTVDAGTLLLGKTNNATAIPGDLVVGDSTDPAMVQETVANQIGNPATTVPVNLSATFDLDGQDDTIGSLVLTGSSVTTETGVLTLSGNVTVNSSSTMAAIGGNLDLPAGAHTIAIADPAVGQVDVEVSAAISGPGGITKTGTGRLDLTGNSSYTGATMIGAGIVSLADSNALGGTSGVTIAAGAELDLSGGITVGAPITAVQGTGTPGSGAIVNLGGVQQPDRRHHARRWHRDRRRCRPAHAHRSHRRRRQCLRPDRAGRQHIGPGRIRRQHVHGYHHDRRREPAAVGHRRHGRGRRAGRRRRSARRAGAGDRL
jgi:autotransporter-associated beta strand protein